MSGTNSGLTSGLQSLSQELGNLSSGFQNAGAGNYGVSQMQNTGGGVLGTVANQVAGGSNQGLAGGSSGTGARIGNQGWDLSQFDNAQSGMGSVGSVTGNTQRQGVVSSPVNGNPVSSWNPRTNSVRNF